MQLNRRQLLAVGLAMPAIARAADAKTLRVGSVDVGAVGDTPPVFAQAAHGDLLYIAENQGAPQSILLPAGSGIRTLADLKGKKLAFGRGSSAHNFTLMTL